MSYKELTEQIKELKATTGNHNAQLNRIYDVLEKLLHKKLSKRNGMTGKE